jgi:MFS family permease
MQIVEHDPDVSGPESGMIDYSRPPEQRPVAVHSADFSRPPVSVEETRPHPSQLKEAMAGMGSGLYIYGGMMLANGIASDYLSPVAITAAFLGAAALGAVSVVGFISMLEWKGKATGWAYAALVPMIGHLILAKVLYGKVRRPASITVYPRLLEGDVVGGRTEPTRDVPTRKETHWSTKLIGWGAVVFLLGFPTVLGPILESMHEPVLKVIMLLGGVLLMGSMMVTGFIVSLRLHKLPWGYAFFALLFPIGPLVLAQVIGKKKLGEAESRLRAALFPRSDQRKFPKPPLPPA